MHENSSKMCVLTQLKKIEKKWFFLDLCQLKSVNLITLYSVSMGLYAISKTVPTLYNLRLESL